jgi:hypothetical protein
MFIKYFTTNRSKLLPWLAMAFVLIIATCQLRYQGRLWTCACGRLYPWAGDVWSSHNSQHLADPYSFTHVLHGLLLCGLVSWALPRFSLAWRLWAVISIEALWEVVENSAFVIQRYREATLSLDYYGDTILNSMGDILFCVIGFMVARRLGFRRSLVFFIVTDMLLLIWIRDSLLLNIVMLIHPIDAIKTWQMGH